MSPTLNTGPMVTFKLLWSSMANDGHTLNNILDDSPQHIFDFNQEQGSDELAWNISDKFAREILI